MSDRPAVGEVGGPFPPDCAERFRHVRQIGAGGFGAVHEAVQIGLDRPVAIKLLLPEILRDAEQVARFVNEARTTAALSHPGVVRVLDHGAVGVPWIAYEFVEGRTLRQVLDASPSGLPLAIAVEIAAQVGAALDASHGLGILHRDIKPENVIDAGGGIYKVMDFGIAKWASSGVSTNAGVVLGTPWYMSPEHLYYRLAVVSVELPPLRQRPEDLPGLVDALLGRLAGGGVPRRIEDEALSVLAAQAWPGNVRELRNVLEPPQSGPRGGSLRAPAMLRST